MEISRRNLTKNEEISKMVKYITSEISHCLDSFNGYLSSKCDIAELRKLYLNTQKDKSIDKKGQFFAGSFSSTFQLEIIFIFFANHCALQ